MKNKIRIKSIIKSYKNILEIEGDKSLSIRWALLASQATGKSKSINLLKSEDVLNTLYCLQKLGVKVRLSKNSCEIDGKGINSFNYKKNTVLNAGNSGTLGRLIMGLLIHSNNKIRLIGDKSLSQRDFLRVVKPLEKFGAKFKTNLGKLPITIEGTKNPKSIRYNENKGSAQCKSAVMLAALNTNDKSTSLDFCLLGVPTQIKINSDFEIAFFKSFVNINLPEVKFFLINSSKPGS